MAQWLAHPSRRTSLFLSGPRRPLNPDARDRALRVRLRNPFAPRFVGSAHRPRAPCSKATMARVVLGNCRERAAGRKRHGRIAQPVLNRGPVRDVIPGVEIEAVARLCGREGADARHTRLKAHGPGSHAGVSADDGRTSAVRWGWKWAMTIRCKHGLGRPNGEVGGRASHYLPVDRHERALGKR